VNEYIRELAAMENIRDSGEQELQQDPSSTFSNLIHSGTLFQLELRVDIQRLKSMRLKPPFETFIPSIVEFDEHKIALWKRMVEIGSEFIGGPKPGVDYGGLAAEMPQIRGELDYIDQSLFQVTPAVFETLVDLKPDSKGHASHLIITKAEKAQLLDDIATDFGTKVEQPHPNYTVAAALVLKTGLLKDFKCSDEPWE